MAEDTKSQAEYHADSQPPGKRIRERKGHEGKGKRRTEIVVSTGWSDVIACEEEHCIDRCK